MPYHPILGEFHEYPDLGPALERAAPHDGKQHWFLPLYVYRGIHPHSLDKDGAQLLKPLPGSDSRMPPDGQVSFVALVSNDEDICTLLTERSWQQPLTLGRADAVRAAGACPMYSLGL